MLFDIDGTLLLSLGAGRRAIAAAMRDEVALPDSVVRETRLDGKTDPQIVREMLGAAGHDPDDARLIAAILHRYVDLLKVELARPGHRTEVMPGVPELLDRVEGAHDTVLGLLTGNIETGASLKLAAGGIHPGRFAVGAFGSDHHARSELPAIAAGRAEPLFGRRPAGAEIVIIGDTPADVTCGRAVGARAIGVATGAFNTGDLLAAGAFTAFTDLSDCAAVWEAIWA